MDKKGKKRIIIAVVVGVAIIVIPPVLVHILFSIPAFNSFFEAKWTAGELITYIAGVESLAGTLFLGIITVRQTQKANALSLNIAKESNELQKAANQNLYPILKVQTFQTEKVAECNSNTIKSVQAQEGLYIEETVSMDTANSTIIIQFSDKKKIKYSRNAEIVLKNISNTVISKIRFEKVLFPEVKMSNIYDEKREIIGLPKYNGLDVMLLPGETLSLDLLFLIDSKNRCEFWEYASGKGIGSFDISLFLHSESISGIGFDEKISILYPYNMKERYYYQKY